MIKVCEKCGGLYATENGETFAGTPCMCNVRSIGGIIIPSRPPIGVVESLRNFVEAIEEYDRSGVWPDNSTLRKLADEGREALNFGHKPK